MTKDDPPFDWDQFGWFDKVPSRENYFIIKKDRPLYGERTEMVIDSSNLKLREENKKTKESNENDER